MALNDDSIHGTARVLGYYTNDWGAYERHLEAEKHEVGKRNTQKIERKNRDCR